MNERIREIAEKSGIHPSNFEPDADIKDSLEKFAKLIIQECALQCIHNEDIDLIEKYFGIEE